ncbi:alternative ribosome rescue factor ArfA [Psychromonas algicola]|uniref:alternative ribosome rescue factor ArfA n=1 Tax=Psychromonas algicola TaxID=2555642 RepID=UPI001FBA5647|nr:alternative ribosome rescue factor ArfA [Psychromonas sp. RZ5]
MKKNKGVKAATLPQPEIAAKTQKQTDIARGTINHSALGALVTSKVFKLRVEKAKKGKGSFKRKAKHSGKECYQIAA